MQGNDVQLKAVERFKRAAEGRTIYLRRRIGRVGEGS